jgi:hypothetical protein
MKAGITLKLFLAILAATSVAAAAMAFATRWSFQSGFLGYLTQLDAQRIEALSATLADEYRRQGSWDFVRNDYSKLREIVANSAQLTQRFTLVDARRALVVGNPESFGRGRAADRGRRPGGGLDRAGAATPPFHGGRGVIPAGAAACGLAHCRLRGGARGGAGSRHGARVPPAAKARRRSHASPGRRFASPTFPASGASVDKAVFELTRPRHTREYH